MSLIAKQPVVSPPTLLQLKTLARPRALRMSVTASRRVRRSSRVTLTTPDDQQRRLRIDPAEPVGSPLSSTVATTERRLSRLTGKPDSATGSEIATDDLPETDPDWFHDHAGDLISGLGQWSMRLDQRESELDQRERELNRRLRFLRQHQHALSR